MIVAEGLGNADRIAEDPESGLALLRVYGRHKLAPLALANGTPKPGELTLVGMPDPKEQDGRKPLTEIKARLTDGAAIELRQPVPMAGFSGAAALDASGKFLGMTEMRNAVLASAAPLPPPVRLVPAQTIRAFLEARDIAATPSQSARCPSSGRARDLREEIAIYSSTSAAAFRRRPSCLPSDLPSQTASGTCDARSGCLRQAAPRTSG